MMTKTVSTQFKSLITGQVPLRGIPLRGTFTKITVCLALVTALFTMGGNVQIAFGHADWRISLERLRVSDAQEEDFWSDGDEPYFVVIGFRSRFNTPNSTSAFWSGVLDDDWAEGSDDGDETNIPIAMGRVSFPNVHIASLGEIAGGTMPEVVGALAIAIESDSTPWRTIRDMMNDLRSSLRGEVERLIEDGELDLDDPDDDIEAAVENVKDSIEGSFWDAVESFFDADDFIGHHVFLFTAVDASVPLNFPPVANATLGRLTRRQFTLNNNPIVFSGDGATYRVRASVTFNNVHAAPGHPGVAETTNKLVTTWGKIKSKY